MVSMVRERKPEGLFRYFESHGMRIEKPYAGIYYVLDKVLFPTQLIVTKELDREAHMWLRSLSNNLEKQEIRKLFGRVEGIDTGSGEAACGRGIGSKHPGESAGGGRIERR